jgi:hypothetical protein
MEVPMGGGKKIEYVVINMAEYVPISGYHLSHGVINFTGNVLNIHIRVIAPSMGHLNCIIRYNYVTGSTSN